MKLTKNSKKLISFFMDNNCINYIHPTKKVNTILLKLYNEMKNAEEYIDSLKAKNKGNTFYNVKVDEIHSISQIPKPSTFPADGFPPEIRKHIDDFSMSKITYHIHLLDRKVTIYFLLEDMNPQTKNNSIGWGNGIYANNSYSEVVGGNGGSQGFFRIYYLT